MSIKSKRTASAIEQNPPTGPLEIVAASEDYLGNTMSDGSYYLRTQDIAVHVTNAVTGDYTIYLPNVSEAKGEPYAIRTTLSSTGDVIVDESDESIDTDLPKTLGDTLDYILLYSDGAKWYILSSDTD